MKKRTTLGEAETILKKYKNNKSIILDVLESIKEELPELPKEKRPVLAVRFIKDSVEMRHCYCQSCDHEWEEKEKYGYYRWNGKPCPKCGNKNMKFDNNIASLSYLNGFEDITIPLEINSERGYIVFATFKPDFKFDYNGLDPHEEASKGNYDYLKGNYTYNFSNINPQYSIFLIDKGFRILGVNSWEEKLLSPTNSTHIHAVNTIYESLKTSYKKKEVVNFFEENDVKVVDENIPETLKDIVKNINSKKKTSTIKKPSKAQIELETYIKYTPHNVDSELLIKKSAVSLSLLKDRIGTVSTYYRYCPHCGKITIGELENSKYICDCGAENSSNNNYRTSKTIENSQSFEIFELMDGTNDFLIRVFDICETMSLDEFDVNFDVKEKYRFFFTDKKIIILRNDDTCWNKDSVYALDENYWASNNYIQDQDEVKEIIKKSNLKYSGLIEAWGLTGMPEIDSFGKYDRNSYLYQWYKKPCMEQLLKTGLTNATKQLLSMEQDRISQYVNVNGTTVYTILDCTKPVFNIARKKNLRLNEILEVKKCWEIDHTLTEEMFSTLKNIGLITEICEISKNYNIPFNRIIEYLDSCYNNQCIDKKNALTIWKDYLRMAKDMTYRLDNKNTKYPQSLKKEHDRATFAYKVVQDKANQERFKKQAEENSKYEYSFDKLFVKIPKTPEEIIEEGTNQKHCVASYVNRVREGNTVIAFIRYKEFPNDSYFTLEIRDDAIVQCKGYTNCAPTDKKLLEFLQKFAKAKKLQLKY